MCTNGLEPDSASAEVKRKDALLQKCGKAFFHFLEITFSYITYLVNQSFCVNQADLRQYCGSEVAFLRREVKVKLTFSVLSGRWEAPENLGIKFLYYNNWP